MRRRGGRPVRQGRIRFWFAGVLAVLVLIASGAAYREVGSELEDALNDPITLPVPLEEIPLEMDGWVGEDQEIPATTRSYMERNFADDFISRRYINEEAKLHADVYVVYCSSRPAGILGHQPRVCMPAHGWMHDGTTESEIILPAGREIPCLVHEFHRSSPVFQQVYTVHFYLWNGRITLSESEFSGIFKGRRLNLSGDPTRYVAQVQISSVHEHAAVEAAEAMVGTILEFLPDPNGYVEAAERLPHAATSRPSPAAR